MHFFTKMAPQIDIKFQGYFKYNKTYPSHTRYMKHPCIEIDETDFLKNLLGTFCFSRALFNSLFSWSQKFIFPVTFDFF